jgi:hypothetical protein
LTQFEDDENLEETGILEMDMKQLSIHQAKTGDHEMLHENKAGEVTAIEGASNISRGKTGEITLYRTYTSG